jgi:hypothetical protein
MVTAATFASTTYLGPSVPLDVKRAQPFSYSSNLSAAYVPNRLLHTARESHRLAVETLLTKPRVNLSLLRDLEDDIGDHFEYRIQDFYHRLTLVCNTQVKFDDYFRADSQVGSPNKKDSIAPQLETEGRYDAAHSSTLPCLRIEGDGDTSVVFAKDSSFYYAWNATVCLPRVVNEVDIRLDSSSTQIDVKRSLRERSIRLLNRVSSGKITPKEGMLKFLQSTNRRLGRLREKENSEEVALVLKAYLGTSLWYERELERSDEILRRLSFHPDSSRYQERTQREMLTLLHREMEKKRPKSAVYHRKPGENPYRFCKFIAEFTLGKIRNGKLNSKTAQGYEEICLKTDKVRARVSKYLCQQKDRRALIGDLERILKIRSASTLHKLDLSEQILKIHQAATEAICSQYNTQDPRNMGPIILKLIYELSKDSKND